MSTVKLVYIDGLTPPELTKAELHYYLFAFSELAQLSDQYGLNLPGLLSSQEETRARRFLNPQHGDNFRLARGTLRHLLGQYCRLQGESLVFNYNEYGKPFLDQAGSPDLPKVQFNVSHSHKLCAFCFSDDIKVGIDVEQHRELNNRDDLQERVCTADEIAYLRSLEREAATQAFYRIWCRKEAFIKAFGRGLSLGLNSIDVLKDAITYPNEQQDPSHWRVCDLPTDLDCGFACAYELPLGSPSA